MKKTAVVALAALAALALSSCGSASGPAPRSGSEAGTSTGKPGDPSGPPPAMDQEVMFMDMLNRVAAPCSPDVPPAPAEPTKGEAPPRQPGGPLPVGPVPPTDTGPADARDGSPDDPEELSPVEECGGRRHAARIGKELDALTDPTPAQVRAALNRLGYIDPRIHGLDAPGKPVRFLLDLRVLGGELCLSGRVSAGRTAIKAFALSPEKPVTNVKPAD